MDEFPFSSEEWERVKQATWPVTNATLWDDPILHAAKLVELKAVLDDLRRVHGDHPILIETEADFAEDPRQSCELYAQALEIARREDLPTYSICISYASALLHFLNQRKKAFRLLYGCSKEVEQCGDDWDKEQWRELIAECRA